MGIIFPDSCQATQCAARPQPACPRALRSLKRSQPLKFAYPVVQTWSPHHFGADLTANSGGESFQSPRPFFFGTRMDRSPPFVAAGGHRAVVASRGVDAGGGRPVGGGATAAADGRAVGGGGGVPVVMWPPRRWLEVSALSLGPEGRLLTVAVLLAWVGVYVAAASGCPAGARPAVARLARRLRAASIQESLAISYSTYLTTRSLHGAHRITGGVKAGHAAVKRHLKSLRGLHFR